MRSEELKQTTLTVFRCSHVRRRLRISWFEQFMLIPTRFEKSLYDLIRGLRNHKGNEKEYIQNCLKECRSEIRSQDMGRCAPGPPTGSPS
jgi:hypothetical protein